MPSASRRFASRQEYAARLDGHNDFTCVLNKGEREKHRMGFRLKIGHFTRLRADYIFYVRAVVNSFHHAYTQTSLSDFITNFC